jgi:hypothetical protein
MGVKTYDPSTLSVIYDAYSVTGFGPDSAVTIETDEDDFELAVGVDGEGTRTKTSNKSATITIELMQTSASNDVLSAKRNADVGTPGGTGGKPLIVKDNSGTSIFACETAWIQKPPTAEYNRSPNGRPWVFRTDRMDANWGSN